MAQIWSNHKGSNYKIFTSATKKYFSWCNQCDQEVHTAPEFYQVGCRQCKESPLARKEKCLNSGEVLLCSYGKHRLTKWVFVRLLHLQLYLLGAGYVTNTKENNHFWVVFLCKPWAARRNWENSKAASPLALLGVSLWSGTLSGCSFTSCVGSL